jgi:uncharacterized iron-regulated protein
MSMIIKFLLAAGLIGVIFACAAAPPRVFIKDNQRYITAGRIISTTTGRAVSFDEMLADLSRCRVVYVSERSSWASPRLPRMCLSEWKWSMSPTRPFSTSGPPVS